MSKKKIAENKPNNQGKHIHESLNIRPDDEAVHFSFKHLNINHPKFSIKSRDSRYFEKMLDRLKNVSMLRALEIKTNRSKSLRAHPIDWDKTSEKNGFSHLNVQLKECQPYQFEVCEKEHGRIHGFFIDNVFYIVWLDPEHKLYP